MSMKCAEDPFNMGIFFIFLFFFLPKASFIMGTFSDPKHTHPGISYWSSPPPPGFSGHLQQLEGDIHQRVRSTL